jgi:hypothetical protein
VTVVCCQVEASATGRSLVQSPTECGCVSECYHETSTVRIPKTTRTVEPCKIKVISSYFPLTEISSFCHHQPRVGVYAFYRVRSWTDTVSEKMHSFYTRKQNYEKRSLAQTGLLSVCPHGKTRLPLDGFPRNFTLSVFTKICWET